MHELRLATTKREREAVYRFRYDIYVREMKRRQRYADHIRQEIVDPLDDFGFVLAAWNGRDVVGTVRLNLLRDGDIGEYFDMYQLDGISPHQLESTSITTRLMVAKELRSTALGLRLAKGIFTVALDHDVATDFIDCNAPLVSFFQRLGYRKFGNPLSHPEYGDVTVMKLDLHHLTNVRSPFTSLLPVATH